MKPAKKPANPCFSSGPTAKRKGWSPAILERAALGRSHRAKPAKAKIQAVIERSRDLLSLPADWRLAVVPASDTGAFEMAMWSLLGARGVDVLAFESFSSGWAADARNHLRLEDLRVFEAPYGAWPDTSALDPARDLVLAWNGTTSGVRPPNDDFIDDDREGLVLCDATSAAFAFPLPWAKCDVVTWSWQKCLGGEAQHGMLALSPRAVERLKRYEPPWPLPKIFRMTKGGALIEGLFTGASINTVSLMAVEDALDALAWAESLGGGEALHRRVAANLATLEHWVEGAEWIDFLAPATLRSPTSICFRIVDPAVQALDDAGQRAFAKGIADLLDREGVAYDIGAYRDAPPGLRIWGGPTVETDDLAALTPWLDWAFAERRRAL